jgi:hypothetical protein
MIKIGDTTNLGRVIWIDTPSLLISDPLIKIAGKSGLFRASEVEIRPKTPTVEYLIHGRWVRHAWFPNLIEDKREIYE